jgi:hypothetical protein
MKPGGARARCGQVAVYPPSPPRSQSGDQFQRFQGGHEKNFEKL